MKKIKLTCARGPRRVVSRVPAPLSLEPLFGDVWVGE
jgi:hypothetical protein